MSQSSTDILSTKDLSIGYRQGKQENILMSGLDLHLASGELVCMLGPNGVGKSTLLRTLASLQPPLSGQVWLGDTQIEKLSRQEVATGISLVLTDRPAAGNLKVYDLLSLGRHPHTDWSGRLRPQDRQKIEWAIGITKIEHLTDQLLMSLSDGQLQKVMIARALTQDGQLMILDEPTAHLDLPNRVEIMLLLQDLAIKTGKAILVASHELDLSLQTAHKLWIADCNQPIIEGVPEDLVLQGKLSGLFPSPHYELDLESGKVKITHPGRKQVQLSGAGPRLFWTRHALERAGYEVVEYVTEDQVKVVAETNQWRISQRLEILEAKSIGSMLKSLDSLL